MVKSSDFTLNTMEAIGNYKQETFKKLNFRVILVTLRGQVCSAESYQEAMNVSQVGNYSLTSLS